MRNSFVGVADFDRVTAGRDALRALLTAADERADVLETALKKISARCLAIIWQTSTDGSGISRSASM